MGLEGMTASAGLATPGAAAAQDLFQVGTQVLQNYYNRKQASTQNQYNIDMWNRQNAYNTPKQQMQRFTEAGLNPNLMYGQGNAGNAGSAPEMIAPTRRAPNVEILGRIQQTIAMKNQLLQNELAKTQNDFNVQRIKESMARENILGIQATGQLTKNAINDLQLKGRQLIPFAELYKTQLSMLNQQVANAVKSGQLMQSNIDLNAVRKSLYGSQETKNWKSMELMEYDKRIKALIEAEKGYHQKQREALGLEKTDNLLFRGGMNLWKKAKDYWDDIDPWYKRQIIPPSFRK